MLETQMVVGCVGLGWLRCCRGNQHNDLPAGLGLSVSPQAGGARLQSGCGLFE